MSSAPTAGVGRSEAPKIAGAVAVAGGVGSVVAFESAQARIGGLVVWSDVSLEVGAGEFTAILGPNGSGKTTLLRVLLGELPLAAGRVSVLGRPPGEAKRQIGYLPQRRHFDPGVRIRRVDLVRLGQAVPGTQGPECLALVERVEGLLARAGVDDHEAVWCT